MQRSALRGDLVAIGINLARKSLICGEAEGAVELDNRLGCGNVLGSMAIMQDFSSELVLRDEYAAVQLLLIEVRVIDQFEKLVESWVRLINSLRNLVNVHGEPTDELNRSFYIYALFSVFEVGNSIVRKYCSHKIFRDSLPLNMSLADVHAYLQQASIELHNTMHPPTEGEIAELCQFFECER